MASLTTTTLLPHPTLPTPHPLSLSSPPLNPPHTPGGPPKLDPVSSQVQKIKDYGYMHMGAWDLLLSITAKAMLAAEVLRPGQLVSIVPGCLAISRKTSLVGGPCNS